MMLIHAWLAFMAFLLPALAQETVTIAASTVTITTAWTTTVTGPTVTVTTTLGCISNSPSTTPPAATPSSTSAALPPSGFVCPTGGQLVQAMDGTSTLWPCGSPDPTDSITVMSGQSTFTVVPPKDTTSEVWITSTSTQFITATDYTPSESTSTSTAWVTKSEEPTTVVVATSSTTVFLGTSTISDAYPEYGSSSQGSTSLIGTPSSPAVTSSSNVTLSSPHVATSSSNVTPPMSPHATPYASPSTGWGYHGWNSSGYTPGLQSSGFVTGVTGGVSVPPHSHVDSTPLTTQTSTRNVTVTLTWYDTPSADVSIVSKTTTVHAASSTPNTFPPYWNASTSAHPTPTSAMCGEGCDFGNFTINFDEGHDNVVTTSDPFVGVNNPTNHLVFNEGFVYVPTDSDAISPASPPYLVMYLPNRTTTASEQPENGSTRNGSISADGNCISDSAFHFNAYGGSFSCNKGPIPLDSGPDPLNCTLEVSGFRWNAIDQVEGLHAISTFDMVPCSEATVDEDGKCQLTKVDFASEGGDFTDLSSIRMRSYYWSDTAEDRVFFMDDLQLGWTNNNYTAGLTRGGGI